MSTEHASRTRPDMTEIEHLLGKSADAITPDDVATLQLELKVAGTYGGAITGIVDRNTIYAIKWFRFFWPRENIHDQGRISERLDEQAAASFSDLLRAEVPEINRARPEALQRRIDATAGDPFDAAHEARLAGLAFSGGGIRSATFNLGVLQALAELKLLHVFDYLSTVSGGGYIGSWLSAFIKRRANGDPDAAAAKILPVCHRLLGDQESLAIRFLRSYSNYLTPRLGVLVGRHARCHRHLSAQPVPQSHHPDPGSRGVSDGAAHRRVVQPLHRAVDLSLERHAPQLRALRRRPAALLGSRHRRQSGLPAAARPGTVSLVHDAHRDRLPLLAAGIHGRLHRRLLVQPAARPARSSGQDVDDRGRDHLLHDVGGRDPGLPDGTPPIAQRRGSKAEAQPGLAARHRPHRGGGGWPAVSRFRAPPGRGQALLRRPQRSLACGGIRHRRGPQAHVSRRGAPRRSHGKALFRWRARVVEPTRRPGDCIRHRLARALHDLHLCRTRDQLPERCPGRGQVDPGRRARDVDRRDRQWRTPRQGPCNRHEGEPSRARIPGSNRAIHIHSRTAHGRCAAGALPSAPAARHSRTMRRCERRQLARQRRGCGVLQHERRHASAAPDRGCECVCGWDCCSPGAWTSTCSRCTTSTVSD